MRPVILVIDAKATLDIDNRPCAVRIATAKMPDNHFKNVILGFNLGDVHAIGSLVESHHSIHIVHFATHRTRNRNERNHFKA